MARDGKLGIAPCGHSGQAVVGHYYECLQHCEDEEITLDDSLGPVCPKCLSFNTEPFAVDPSFYLYNPFSPIIDVHCVDCGTCWSL